MHGQNRNFSGLDAASGLPVNCGASIVSQMPGDQNIRKYRDYNQNGFAATGKALPSDSRCPISAAGCKMCQPYHHHGTGILKNRHSEERARA